MDDDILDNLAIDDEDILPKCRRLDVDLPTSWEPAAADVARAAAKVSVVDNKAVEASGLPVFDVHLYVLTITCLQVEKLLREES